MKPSIILMTSTTAIPKIFRGRKKFYMVNRNHIELHLFDITVKKLPDCDSNFF